VNAFLAIDTTTGTSVAVVAEDRVLAEINVDDRMGHSENIGSALAEVLKRADVRASELTAVVAGRGPAPFTGLRVGLAAAVAFAEGIGRPLFGVVSHDAMALAAFDAGVQATAQHPLLITTDARRSEVYFTLYSGLDSQGIPTRMTEPAVAKPADLEALLKDRGITAQITDVTMSAAALGRVAQAQLLVGLVSDDVTALYLRAPDATVPKSHVRVGKGVS
jgi:tRNA threonylcarbamoyl adenosine modification protein YeaZ